jgi:hypothetical protein
MNLILKQVLIIGSVFTIIYWFQQKDDLKTKRIRTTFIEKYKLPILVSSIVGLLLNLKNLMNSNCNKTITELTIVAPISPSRSTPVKKCSKINDMSKPFLNSNNFGTKSNNLTWFSKNPNEQQIFTDLPDF